MLSPLLPVCPACHGGLESDSAGGEACSSCGAAWPKRAEVPVYLTDEEWRESVEHLEREREANDAYQRARRGSPMARRYYDAWVGRMLAGLPEGAGPIVEPMCGGAEICRRLPEGLLPAFAIDLDAPMVERAARDLGCPGGRGERIVLACGSAARLPLADGSAGAVVIQGGLHHARPLLPKVLREIARVLRPGGLLVASEPANDNPVIRRIRAWQYRSSRFQGNDLEEEGFTREELAEALAAAGLRLERYERFGFVAYPLMGNVDLVPLLARSDSKALARTLLGLDALLERIPVVRSFAWASLFRAVK